MPNFTELSQEEIMELEDNAANFLTSRYPDLHAFEAYYDPDNQLFVVANEDDLDAETVETITLILQENFYIDREIIEITHGEDGGEIVDIIHGDLEEVPPTAPEAIAEVAALAQIISGCNDCVFTYIGG